MPVYFFKREYLSLLITMDLLWFLLFLTKWSFKIYKVILDIINMLIIVHMISLYQVYIIFVVSNHLNLNT